MQVNPGAASALSQEGLNQLFECALRLSGPAAHHITSEGFATAVLDSGLAGVDTHKRRQYAVEQRQPYSEFRWDLCAGVGRFTFECCLALE